MICNHTGGSDNTRRHAELDSASPVRLRVKPAMTNGRGLVIGSEVETSLYHNMIRFFDYAQNDG